MDVKQLDFRLSGTMNPPEAEALLAFLGELPTFSDELKQEFLEHGFTLDKLFRYMDEFYDGRVITGQVDGTVNVDHYNDEQVKFEAKLHNASIVVFKNLSSQQALLLHNALMFVRFKSGPSDHPADAIAALQSFRFDEFQANYTPIDRNNEVYDFWKKIPFSLSDLYVLQKTHKVDTLQKLQKKVTKSKKSGVPLANVHEDLVPAIYDYIKMYKRNGQDLSAFNHHKYLEWSNFPCDPEANFFPPPRPFNPADDAYVGNPVDYD